MFHPTNIDTHSQEEIIMKKFEEKKREFENKEANKWVSATNDCVVK